MASLKRYAWRLMTTQWWPSLQHKREIYLGINFSFLTFVEVWTEWVSCKVSDAGRFERHILCTRPLRSYIGVHTSMSVRKMKFFSLIIYTLFLYRFGLLFVKLWCKSCKISGEEKLQTDAIGHYVQQPSPWSDVNRTSHRPINTFICPWRRLYVTSWCSSSMYEPCWSKKVNLRQVVVEFDMRGKFIMYENKSIQI